MIQSTEIQTFFPLEDQSSFKTYRRWRTCHIAEETAQWLLIILAIIFFPIHAWLFAWQLSHAHLLYPFSINRKKSELRHFTLNIFPFLFTSDSPVALWVCAHQKGLHIQLYWQNPPLKTQLTQAKYALLLLPNLILQWIKPCCKEDSFACITASSAGFCWCMLLYARIDCSYKFNFSSNLAQPLLQWKCNKNTWFLR